MTTTQQAAGPKAHRFINDIRPGEQVTDGVYLVSQKDLRTTTNGGLYIHLVLVDRTGQLLTRVWQATQEMYETIPEGGFIRVRGRAESYKGALQFIVDGLRPATPGQFEIGDYMPHTVHDVEDMWQRVLAILRTVRHPKLLALIKRFVTDEEIIAGFKKAPAAIQNHHAYIGGLLEHTCSLMELAVRIFGANGDDESHYPEVSRDLILAGLFLHDIGKISELTFDTNFTYSTTGQLVGHIAVAAIWIDRKAREVEQETGEPFPPDLQDVLTHIVLAHHGTHEFGSPKLPSCPEAIIIHFLDNIDARLNMAFTAINSAKSTGSDWTEYVRALAAKVYRRSVTAMEEPNSPADRKRPAAR